MPFRVALLLWPFILAQCLASADVPCFGPGTSFNYSQLRERDDHLPSSFDDHLGVSFL